MPRRGQTTSSDPALLRRMLNFELALEGAAAELVIGAEVRLDFEPVGSDVVFTRAGQSPP